MDLSGVHVQTERSNNSDVKYKSNSILALAAAIAFLISGASARDASGLAKQTQNPVANLPTSINEDWNLTSTPINTINWNASSGERWTVPLGMGVGKVHTIGNQPVNISAHAYYNVEHPTLGADWQFRLQVQFLFPKS